MNGKTSIERSIWRLWKSLQKYFANCSIHGMRYLVEHDRHWTERLFWLIGCGLSWWGCIVMITNVFTDLANQQVAMSVDTNYYGWEGELPSIHVCNTNSPQAETYIKKTWPLISRVRGLTNALSLGYLKRLPEPHDSQAFEGVAKALNIPCDDVFESCEWNKAKVNCCSLFRPLVTSVGHCHSFNSLHTRDFDNSNNDNDQYFKRNSSSNGLFSIIFRDRKNQSSIYEKMGFSSTTIYIMDNVEFPDRTTFIDNKVTSNWKSKHVRVNVKQDTTYNEEGVRGVPIEKRNCRFADETDNFQYYSVYGVNVCLAENQLNKMIESCGCVSHLYAHNAYLPVCNYTQIACLFKASPIIHDTSNITCVAPCEEKNYKMFTTYHGDSRVFRRGRLDVYLLPGPTLRYHRYTVRSKLDLIVTVGGTMGLFVGASILSFAEIPYWLLVENIQKKDSKDKDGGRLGKDANPE